MSYYRKECWMVKNQHDKINVAEIRMMCWIIGYMVRLDKILLAMTILK